MYSIYASLENSCVFQILVHEHCCLLQEHYQQELFLGQLGGEHNNRLRHLASQRWPHLQEVEPSGTPVLLWRAWHLRDIYGISRSLHPYSAILFLCLFQAETFFDKIPIGDHMYRSFWDLLQFHPCGCLCVQWGGGEVDCRFR